MAAQSPAPVANPMAAESPSLPPDMMLSRAAEDAPQCFVTDTQRTVCPARGKALPFSDEMLEDVNARVATESMPLTPMCKANARDIQCMSPMKPARTPATVAEDSP